MKKWMRVCAAVCFCTAGLMTACGKENAVTDTQNTQAGEEVLSTEEPTEVNPHEGEAKSFLTGEWIEESLQYRRPVAVMTENTKVTLPQYGLAQADVIYECPVEGGITRLMAIYQDYSGMEKVGNVRSCRLYYIYFAKEFDAVYFHAGESKYAKDLLNSSFIDNVDGITGKAAPYYYRDNSRRAPHNFYTSSDRLAEAVAAYGYSDTLAPDTVSHYRFAEEEAPNLLLDGEDAAVLKLYYVDPKPWFEYNSEDNKYYRYEFGEPQVDGITGEQLAVTNIIIQHCKSSLKDAGNGTLDIDPMTGGAGKYLTMGRAIDITWSRASESDRTVYYDSSGQELVLNPGTTWVEIVEESRADRNMIYSSKDEFQ